MTQSGFQPFKAKSCLPSLGGERVLPHQYYMPNYKAKSKSRAASHNMEFLSQVFANEGASRFFKIFLLRFLFDTGKQSSEDAFTPMGLLAA